MDRDNENDIDRAANIAFPVKIENFQARSCTKENGADRQRIWGAPREENTLHGEVFLRAQTHDGRCIRMFRVWNGESNGGTLMKFRSDALFAIVARPMKVINEYRKLGQYY